MRKKDQQKRIRLIYARYILPPILILLTFLSMLLPSYQYIVGSDLRDTLSLSTLLKNALHTARQTIYGPEEASALDTSFSKFMIAFCLILLLLAAISFAASLYCTVVSMRCFTSEDEEKAQKSRTLFITFFPRRIVLILAQAAILPPAFFAYELISIYKSFYSISVKVLPVLPGTATVALLSFIAIVVLTYVTAPWERELDADIFKKANSEQGSVERTQDEPQDDEVFEQEDESKRERYSELVRLLKEDKNQK